MTVVLGGDVMFGRWRDDRWRAHREAETLSRLQKLAGPADLTMVNLESAICEEESARGATIYKDGGVQLTAPPQTLDLLAGADIDLVSVANNHAFDCGPDSLERTEEALEERGLDAVGAALRKTGRSAPVEMPLGESATAVVLATTLSPPTAGSVGAQWVPDLTPTEEFSELIERARSIRHERPKALILVSVHWGGELAEGPGPLQIERARKLIDAGADVVMGHGSHVFQRTERHRGGVIAYGLGNLHFDMREPLTRRRAVVKIEFELTSGKKPTLLRVEEAALSTNLR